MAELFEAPGASLVLVERSGPEPRIYLESRPALKGLPNAGRIGFFGGLQESGEDPWAAMFREIDEELKWKIPRGGAIEYRMVGNESVQDTTREGAQVLRSLTLFHALLPPDTKVQKREYDHGELVSIAPEPGAVAALKPALIPYTYEQLRARVNGEGYWKKTATGIWQ